MTAIDTAIAELVATAPPLTEAQRARLASLLAPSHQQQSAIRPTASDRAQATLARGRRAAA